MPQRGLDYSVLWAGEENPIVIRFDGAGHYQPILPTDFDPNNYIGAEVFDGQLQWQQIDNGMEQAAQRWFDYLAVADQNQGNQSGLQQQNTSQPTNIAFESDTQSGNNIY